MQFALSHSKDILSRIKLIQNCTASYVDEKMALLISLILPVKIEYANEIIINIGHNILSIFFSYLLTIIFLFYNSFFITLHFLYFFCVGCLFLILFLSFLLTVPLFYVIMYIDYFVEKCNFKEEIFLWNQLVLLGK